jgi:hypothetical protein
MVEMMLVMMQLVMTAMMATAAALVDTPAAAVV